jgi:hypothetical protein
MMTDVLVRLQAENLKAAVQLADDIRAAGNLTYTDNSGSTVNVTVGDVTVDNAG